MNRRELLKILSLSAPFATLLSSTKTNDIKHFYDEVPPKIDSFKNYIRPLGLKKGISKVAITAPASPVTMYEMRNTIRFFKKNDIELVIGKTITERDNKYRYLSASDQQRAEEYMQFTEDDSIDGIMCGRGGYGVMRILDKLDFNVIKNNPKVIVGFSDITALISPITEITGLVTFHGPVAATSFNRYTQEYFQRMTFSQNKFKPIEIQEKSAIVINEGEVEGELKGGNMRMIISTLGTPYEPDFTDSIVFLEDVSEPSYKIDRMITQLKLSGKFDNCKAIIFGKFKNLNSRQSFYPTYSFTIKEVIKELLTPLNIPIVIGMPFGHVSDHATLPLGIKAELNTKEKNLKITQSAVI